MVIVPERPFTRTRLDEERVRDRAEVITLKLNVEERAALEEVKELLDIAGDGPAIKLLVEVGRKVIRDTFPVASLKWLVSLRRVRYDARKRRSAPQFEAESNTVFGGEGNTS